MDEIGGIETKSSNEILCELFGAFNAEPPEINDKSKTDSDADDSDHSKKPKKSKRKKSKKKHKNKSKKHKKKCTNSDNCFDLESNSAKLKKKKKKNKEKKVKKSKRLMSPSSVNIELSANQVPMALEIMLDGTVGIKGDDGVIKKIPDDKENDDHSKDISTNVAVENGNAEYSAVNDNQSEKTDIEKTDEKKSANPIKIQEVFESETVEQSDKQKKGKIQIRNLKFSSVFQETVKAVEEKQKKEQERKADIEEGELSDSSGSEQHLEYPETKDKRHRKSRVESSNHHRSSINYKNDGIRSHTKDMSHQPKPKSSARARSRSPNHTSKKRQRSRSRYSRERYYHKRRRSRSRSRDHRPLPYYSGGSYRKRSHKSSSSSRKSYHSGSRDRHRSRSRSRRSREKRIKLHSSHRSHSKNRSKTTSKERSASIEKIDKEKLLAIARKNALKLIDAGMVPGADKLTAIKAGGKTVNELTEYCKKLSKKEALGKEVSDSESESSDEEDRLFHHPFQVRDRPNSIILNIKNAVPLPVKSHQEIAAEQSKQLKLQFPVSSGTSHRETEMSDWVPVSPRREESQEKITHAQQTSHTPIKSVVQPQTSTTSMAEVPQSLTSATADISAALPQEVYNRPVFPVIQPNPPVQKRDISTIVSKRLDAMRKLQENPNDSRALDEMHNAQQEMQDWAESRQDAGASAGNTAAKSSSPPELNSGGQAWAKRNQLTAATPVKGGMGMALLQKMGWQPGEGLGKNKEGTLEPLRLEVKMDKKGLVASDESNKGKKQQPSFQMGTGLPAAKSSDGKHPVSLLNEFCSRRRFGAPQFDLCFECGPDHKKNFLFKVKVNGTEYTPSVASPNKKQAKAEAAAICLKALGVISTSNSP